MYISLYVFAWTWSQGVFPLHQVSTVGWVLVLSSGPDKKERAKRNEYVRMLHFWLVITSKVLRNVHKAACIWIPCFLTNFPITKSLLSLSNTEILLFLAIVFNTYDWLKSLNTHKKCPLKMELFRRLPFCKFTHSLCKIENIPMGGKRIVP